MPEWTIQGGERPLLYVESRLCSVRELTRL